MQLIQVASDLNVPEDTILANVTANLRRQWSQVKPYQPTAEELILVGGGPTLETTWPTLRRLHWETGRKIVAMNGSYEWLIARNLKPSAMVVLDARPWNVRFLTEPVPGCKYFLASQCDPGLFARVESWGVESYIFHVCPPHQFGPLDAYYGEQGYRVIIGGSTVMLRSMGLLRMLGFQSYHVFGFDSCVLPEAHHAYAQPENDDEVRRVMCAGREFQATAWQVSQARDFLAFVRACGEWFRVQVYGDGLVAWMIQQGAEAEIGD